MSVKTKAPSVSRIKRFTEDPHVSEATRFGHYAQLDEIPGLILGLMTFVDIVTSLCSLAYMDVFRRERASVSRIGFLVLALTMSSLGWHPSYCHAAESSLMEQAKRQFPRRFTKCEKELLTKAAKGESASCTLPDRQTTDGVFEDVGTREMRYDVEANLLSWICKNPKASKLIDGGGIQLSGSRVRGQFDLSNANVPFPLTFQSTLFEGPIIVDHATLNTLDLTGSEIRGMSAKEAILKGDLNLNKLQSRGRISLTGASVGGDLHAERASFDDPIIVDHATLNELDLGGSEIKGMSAKEAILKGDLNLDELQSRGRISLIGASIRGDLNAEGASIGASLGDDLQAEGASPDSIECVAFDADRINVTGDIKLSDRFSSSGEVQMRGAKVAGDIRGDKGIFAGEPCLVVRNAGIFFNDDSLLMTGSLPAFIAEVTDPGPADPGHFVALDMSGSNAEQYVLLQDASFSGDIILDNAQVARDLELDRVRCSDGSALMARHATIKGAFFWQEVDHNCASVVVLDVKDATVGPLHDDRQSWPQKGNLLLDGFSYSRFAEGSPKDAQSRKEWLSNARLPSVVNTADFDAQPYQQVANVLRDNGDEAGAKQVQIALEDARRQQQDLGFIAHLCDFVYSHIMVYGYEPSRGLVFAGLLVLLGWVIFYWGKQTIVLTNPAARRFNPFIYSLENFLPLVDLGQSKLWTPDASSRRGRCIRSYLWAHVLLGWFFTTTIIIASVTGLVRK